MHDPMDGPMETPVHDAKPVAKGVVTSCGVLALVAGLALCLALTAAAAYFTLAG